MLIIGHRGAAGIAPENTLTGIRAGINDGADIIEFDIRLTADNIPVLIHDGDLKRTHGIDKSIRSMTLEQLTELKLKPAIPTLEDIIKKYVGKVLLNIEVKSRNTAGPVLNILNQYCGESTDKWDTIFVSSFLAKELLLFRKHSKRVNLALLHHNNPFLYIAYHRRIHFSAVGFHRLHINRLATEIAKKADIFTYAFTSDRSDSVRLLQGQGMDGIVTNYPAKIADALDRS